MSIPVALDSVLAAILATWSIAGVNIDLNATESDRIALSGCHWSSAVNNTRLSLWFEPAFTQFI